MSERAAGKKFTGPLSRPALARRVDLSATSLSLEGWEGSRTAGQDGQNGRDGTAGPPSCLSYPSCPSFFDLFHPQRISPAHEGHVSEIAIPKGRGMAAAAVSDTDAGTRCDVAPSRFKRFDRDEYFTMTRAGLSRRSAARCKSKARSSSPAPAAATWFANCAHEVLLCAAPISTRTPIRSYLT
jgi:hypothetical protein